MTIRRQRTGRNRRVSICALLMGVTATSLVAFGSSPASAAPARHGHRLPLCSPKVAALGYSDALDKASYDGATVGGLSSLAYDRRAGAWVSAVDNNGSDPSRLWFFRKLAHPRIVRDPLVLRRSDGTAYDGTTADNEGLAVLPDGDYLISSETEPSIRIYGRDGVQRQSLPVPARFAVTGTTPGGEATSNATLEGLTISPSGRTVVAAMEGALSGDVSAGGDATYHRLLVYRAGPDGRWRLAEQLGYRAGAGMRIPEVAAYSDTSFVVEEAAFDATTGNAVSLFAVTGIDRAADVGPVGNLSGAPRRDLVHKTRLANLVNCPTLGAPAKEIQANPLLDNFEGMAVTTPRTGGIAGISLISDDNFSATQTTRVLNLVARLP